MYRYCTLYVQYKMMKSVILSLQGAIFQVLGELKNVIVIYVYRNINLHDADIIQLCQKICLITLTN